MNYAGLRGCDPDIGVEVDKLENDEGADVAEVVLSAEPPQMQNFVQDY